VFGLRSADQGFAEIAVGTTVIRIRATGYGPGTVAKSGDGSVDFVGAPGTPTLWARPTESGAEFGATFADSTVAPTMEYVLDVPKEVSLRLQDGTIYIEGVPAAGTDATEPRLLGAISAPALLENDGQDAPVHITDRTKVELLDQPDGTHILRYSIDADWFGAKERVFPIVLDPSICLRRAAAPAARRTPATTWTPTSARTRPGPIRRAPRSCGPATTPSERPTAAWDQLRSLVFFDAATLSDGWQVTSATLTLREDINRDGATTPKLIAQLISTDWGSTATWNGMNDRSAPATTARRRRRAPPVARTVTWPST